MPSHYPLVKANSVSPSSPSLYIVDESSLESPNKRKSSVLCVTLRRLLSIQTIFLILILFSLVLSIAVVVAISTTSASDIVTGMGAQMRVSAATGVNVALSNHISVLRESVETIRGILKENWNNAVNIETNLNTRTSVGNIIKQFILSNKLVSKILIFYPPGSIYGMVFN
jgi:5-bromo-4-chloroindolyl phosphate hydrolysis protein